MELTIPQLGRMLIESVAGVSTNVVIPGLDLSIDMGRCWAPALRTSRVALTHTHADHVAGIHACLGIRDLYGMSPTTFYCPSEAVDQLTGYLSAMDRLQKRPFAWYVTKMKVDTEVQLKQGYYLRSFPTTHSVPSCGYAVIHRRLKLRPEYQGLSGPVIAAKRARKEMKIFETREDVILAVTGDTTLKGILNNPLIEKAKTVIVESTFLDKKKAIPKAHLGNHIHLDELIPLIDQWTNAPNPKQVILYHISQFYRPAEAIELIEKRLSRRARELVTIVPPEPIV